MRKFLTLVMCILLVGALAVTASADMTNITADKTSVSCGEDVTITISVNCDTPVRRVAFLPIYDTSAFAVKSTSVDFPGCALQGYTSGAFAVAYDAETEASGTMTITLTAIANKATVSVGGRYVAGTGSNNVVDETLSGPTITIQCTHVWGDWAVTKDATCTEQGTKQRVCSSCGEVEEQNFDALGHDWGDWKVTKEPTCAEGEKEHTCKRCGATEREVIPATGNHKWGEWKVTTPATCEKKGTQTRTCSICGETQSQTNIPALGHDFGDWVKVDDNNHQRTCKRSGCDKTETAAHTWEKVEHKEPTCKDDGYDKFQCLDCGAEKIEVIKSTGAHGFNTWTPNADGKTHTSVCDGCHVETKTEDHTWDKEEITKKPTCSTEGEKTYTCKCGATKTEVIPATNEHTYENGKWEKNDAETHKIKCDNCDHYKTESHNWDKGVVTENPTCSKEGVKVYTCKDCKETKQEVLPATGKHDYTAKYEKVDDKTHKAFCDCGENIVEEHKKSTFIKVIQKPTTEKKGLELWACACGHEMEIETPAISGNYDKVPKTGDITGQVILLCVSSMAVLAGIAYGIKRKFIR